MSFDADGLAHVRTWEIRTGALQWVVPINPGVDLPLAFSPDGSTLAVPADGKVVLLDPSTGSRVGALDNEGQIHGLVYSPTGTLLACSDMDGRVSIWETRTSRRRLSLRMHGHRGAALAFSPDGTVLACAEGEQYGRHRNVELFDVRTGDLRRTVRAQGNVGVVGFSSDGQLLAIGSGTWLDAERRLELWDPNTGRLVRSLTGFRYDLRALTFSLDGGEIVASDRRGGVYRWRVADGSLVHASPGPDRWVQVALAPDADLAAVPQLDGGVRLLKTASGQEIRTLTGRPHEASAVCFSPKGDQVFVAGLRKGAVPHGEVVSWDTRTGAWQGALLGGKDLLSILQVAPDGSLLAAAGASGDVWIWDLRNRQLRVRVEAGRGTVFGLEFSPDSRRLAVGVYRDAPFAAGGAGRDEPSEAELRVWELPAGTLYRSVKVKDARFSALAYSPDGRRLLGGGASGLFDWDLSTGDLRRLPPEDPTETPYYAALASRCGLVAMGEGNRPIRIRDLETGRTTQVLSDSSWEYLALALSSDGRFVAASDHRQFRIWDLRSGRNSRTVPDEGQSLEALAFSADGSSLVTLDEAGNVALRDPKLGTLRAVLTFVGPADDWVAATPSGFYAASPGAEAHVNWRLGAALQPAERYHAQFYRPEEVQRALTGTVQAEQWALDQRELPDRRRAVDAALLAAAEVQRPVLPDGNTPDQVLRRVMSSRINTMATGDLRIVRDEIKAQLALGADPRVTGNPGLTALMVFARCGDREGMQDLLRRGVDLNARDIAGNTALLHAVTSENGQIVRDLLDAGAKLNDETGESLLTLTPAERTAALVRMLTKIPRSINAPGRPFNDQATSALLVQLGADAKAVDSQGQSLLFHALTLPLFRILLEKGADPNVRDQRGTPLIEKLTTDRKIAWVQLLLEHGAQVDASAPDGGTALISAAWLGEEELVQALLERGANPNRQSDNGRTALIEAVRHGELMSAAALLARRASVNLVDAEGWTALGYALTRADRALARLLLARGATRNVRLPTGESVSDLIRTTDPTGAYRLRELFRGGI